MDDPHLNEIGFFEQHQHPVEGSVRTMRVPSTWSLTQPRHSAPAPTLGQHTHSVLSEIGYSDIEIEELASDGVIGVPDELAVT